MPAKAAAGTKRSVVGPLRLALPAEAGVTDNSRARRNGPPLAPRVKSTEAVCPGTSASLDGGSITACAATAKL
ncbi:hypothetical protein D3C77_737730 [compost metagenome]